MTLAIPPHQRGVSRSSRTRGGGMRWTRQRFARNVMAGRVGERPVSDQQRADERCCSVRRSRVVLTPRRWRQVRGVKSAQPGLDKTYPLSDGGKQARSPAIECTHLCCRDWRRLIPWWVSGSRRRGLMSMEIGLGRFGDRRLEKGGRRCMRPSFAGLVRAFGALQGTGRRRCGSRVFCAMKG